MYLNNLQFLHRTVTCTCKVWLVCSAILFYLQLQVAMGWTQWGHWTWAELLCRLHLRYHQMWVLQYHSYFTHTLPPASDLHTLLHITSIHVYITPTSLVMIHHTNLTSYEHVHINKHAHSHTYTHEQSMNHISLIKIGLDVMLCKVTHCIHTNTYTHAQQHMCTWHACAHICTSTKCNSLVRIVVCIVKLVYWSMSM